MSADGSKNQVTVVVNPKIYPLEVVCAAAYVFLDRVYVYLDENKEGQTVITLKPKEKATQKQLKALSGEFHNELLNYTLRHELSASNKKIREYIVTRALIGALKEENLEDEDGPIVEKIEYEEWDGDTMGIALPWEEQAKKMPK